jgi:enamine deaminase RidA (YjgF/YER057c/UK114 family)
VPTTKADRTAAIAISEDRELVLLTWVAKECDADSVELAYREIGKALAERGCVPVQERVFCDLAVCGVVDRARARALGGVGSSWPVPATFIEGSPLGGSPIAGIHVIAARGHAEIASDELRAYGTLVETKTARLLGLSDVGRRSAGRLAPGPAEDAAAALDAAERLLAGAGFSFRDVARTWFYLRDILDWYGPFNAVRNAAFARMGLMGANGNGRIPASTGIAGRNPRGCWTTLDLLAVAPRGGRAAGIRRLHSTKQNEATSYGSAFARATEVTLGEARYVFVSGTASIDDRGASAHFGNFEAQARFAIEAVRALLRGTDASLGDIRQATVFLKRRQEAPAFERIAREARLDPRLLVTTIADVCRPELLFEIDATAVLPAGGATK